MKIGMIVIGITLPLCAASALAAPVAYELKRDHTDISFKIGHAGFTMKHGGILTLHGVTKPLTLHATVIVPVCKRIGDATDELGQRGRKDNGYDADRLTGDCLQSHGDGEQEYLQVVGRCVGCMGRPDRIKSE